jgi:hypothetical protein
MIKIESAADTIVIAFPSVDKVCLPFDDQGPLYRMHDRGSTLV